MWTSDRESEPVALEFFSKDYHVMVVNYSTDGLAAYQDEAVLPADIDQISVLDFSAGGNLAGLLAVYWYESWLEDLVNKDKLLYRQNRVILAYAPLDFVGIHFEESIKCTGSVVGGTGDGLARLAWRN